MTLAEAVPGAIVVLIGRHTEARVNHSVYRVAEVITMPGGSPVRIKLGPFGRSRPTGGLHYLSRVRLATATEIAEAKP